MTIGRRDFLTVLAASLPSFVREERPDLAEVDVFRAGDAGYHTYRIPALLATGKGTLLGFTTITSVSAEQLLTQPKRIW